MGWIVTYGIVGLAIAMGALFVNFGWEHPSQLSASFGSFSYMVASSLLIAFCLLPCGGIIALFTLQSLYSEAHFFGIAAGGGLLFFMAVLNYIAVEYAFSVGERSLGLE